MLSFFMMPNLTNTLEKNSSLLHDESPDTVIVGNKSSKSFFQRLIQSPCGDTPKGVNHITLVISAVITWALLYILLQHEVEPGGQLFQLIVLLVFSYFCGWLVSLVHLPPLLGMLLYGIAQKNLGWFNMTGVYSEIVVVIRQVSLAIMLIQAGLGLDPSALKKLSFVVARLAFLPCVTETAATAIAAYVLLGMPWLWGILLGFIVSAVSPAVVVPNLISLQKRGYGEDKGICTLVIAASSIDDIICISGFGVMLGMVLSQGDLMTNVLQGPMEVVIGVVLGLGWGFISAYIPHRNEDHVVLKRSFMVGSGGLVAVLGSQMVGYSGSGPLATIILSFLASSYWKLQGWSNTYNPVSTNFAHIWIMFQPLLFGLIGTEIRLSDINIELIGASSGILLFGAIIRTITCVLTLIGANLNIKENIFVNIAWFPKATVQAALGPVALDLAKRNSAQDAVAWAQSVLSIAILSILATAPIGAIGIALGGPKLLSKMAPDEKKKTNSSADPDVIVTESQIV